MCVAQLGRAVGSLEGASARVGAGLPAWPMQGREMRALPRRARARARRCTAFSGWRALHAVAAWPILLRAGPCPELDACFPCGPAV